MRLLNVLCGGVLTGFSALILSGSAVGQTGSGPIISTDTPPEVAHDLDMHGIQGCPTGSSLAGYCQMKPNWWEQEEGPDLPFSQTECIHKVEVLTTDSPSCERLYRTRLDIHMSMLDVEIHVVKCKEGRLPPDQCR